MMSGPPRLSVSDAYARLMRRTRREGRCLVFTGARAGNGYGKVRADGRQQLAHRVVWQHHHGSIPEGTCVLHHCDTPACVERAHLFTGSHADNSADMVAKKRQAHGERNASAVLTPSQATAVRRLSARGHSQHELARRFGVWQTTIRDIVIGKSWKECT